jgi:hydrogenase maturation protein HypF
MTVMRTRTRARVQGTVQGVGFRPFVYRLAREQDLGGWVLNDERGVLLEVEGARPAVAEFLERLRSEAPPLAVIDGVACDARVPRGERDFRILHSDRGDRSTAALRPRRSPLPLPVRQLHQLRPALHDRHRCPV